jgi:hypothetical protein
MEELRDDVRSQLRSVFAGRSVILAGGVAAAAVRPVEQLRALGATRFLVVAAGAGTGRPPEGPDVDVLVSEAGMARNIVESFREAERAIAQPSGATLDALQRFDPSRDAIVLVPPFFDVRALGERRAFGARRPEWVALEDKTRADEIFVASDVAQPASVVVVAESSAMIRAAAAMDRGEGTVWSADARDGFNGGGTYVRWVLNEEDCAEALAVLVSQCDRIRVATFADGVPCSIHGFVVDDGVAVFRPVELVTLRAASPPRLRYCGCGTFFDPPDECVQTMRGAVRRVGEYLRSSVGFRGAFTIDGIASADGWVATECNPRFGAGLGYVDAVLPELSFLILHYAVAEGVVDVPSAALERVVVDAASRTRWGSLGLPLTRSLAETSEVAVVGGADGVRRVADSEQRDAVLSTGPGRTGGHVGIELDSGRTRAGPSIAPFAVAALAFADRELDLGIGPLEAPA